MFCPVCGASAPDDAVFCGKCGANFSKVQSVAVNQPETAGNLSGPQQQAAAFGQGRSNQQMPPVQAQAEPAKKAMQKVDFPGSKIRMVLSILSILAAVLYSCSLSY